MRITQMKQIKEIRAFQADIQLTSIDDRIVRGTAIVFNQPTDMGDYIETVKPISQEFLNTQDVFALLDHDPSKVLARSNKGQGSLKLTVTETGVDYEFVAPNTIYGDELIEHLKRGEISGSSFAFSLSPKDEVWYYNEDRVMCRDIHSFRGIYDVSPVFQPAYDTTSCNLSDQSLRSKEQCHKDYVNKIVADNNELINGIESIK